MKLTITREQLQEGLVAVAASVPAKTTLPILSNILLEATKEGIRLSGTDLDISVSTTVSASVDQEGAITLPARKLVEIVRELPSAAIRLTASGEQRVTIECGRSKFRLLGLPREEFPAFPSVKFEGGWRTSSKELQKLIGACRLCRQHRREPAHPQRGALGAPSRADADGRHQRPSPGPDGRAHRRRPRELSGRPDRAPQGAGADPPAVRHRGDGGDRAEREPPRLPHQLDPDLHPADRRAVPELRAGHSPGERQGRPRPTRPPSPPRSAG